jgi:hypothetical protein
MSNLREALQALIDNGIDEKAIGPIVNDIVEGNALDDNDDQKYLALISELGAEAIGAEENSYDDCVFDVGGAEYMVLTEDEKESRWDDCLESYLDDCGVEGADSPYFDREAWKRDARMDGAGHALSSYDGSEYEFSGFDEWFFIYRMN